MMRQALFLIAVSAAILGLTTGCASDKMQCTTCGTGSCDLNQSECKTCKTGAMDRRVGDGRPLLRRDRQGRFCPPGRPCDMGGPQQPSGPPSGAITYPYYTLKGPRDFLSSSNNTRPVGP